MIIIRIIFHYDHQHYHSKKLIEVRIDCSFWTTKQRYNIDTGMEQTSWKDSLKNEMLLLIGELRRVLPHSTKQKCRQYFSSFFFGSLFLLYIFCRRKFPQVGTQEDTFVVVIQCTPLQNILKVLPLVVELYHLIQSICLSKSLQNFPSLVMSSLWTPIFLVTSSYRCPSLRIFSLLSFLQNDEASGTWGRKWQT